jgi:arylformamidase
VTAPVFLDYDQERLDALLDVRRRVPDFLAYTDRFEARSAAQRGRPGARLDVRYGAHERERLDVFLPPGATDPLPVNLVFHGGYWRSAEKERYSYPAEAFNALGAAYVAVEYALLPGVTMDELIRQCRAAVVHVHRHAAALGLDAGRLYVSGHSAGGQIIGMLLAGGWQEALDLPADAIRGGCGISGLYDLVPIRRSYLNEVLALDDAAAERNSPERLRPAGDAPLIAAVGGLEGEEFLRQNALMAAAWGATVPVTEIVLEGHHHYTAVEALGDPASVLFHAVAAQMGLAA